VTRVSAPAVRVKVISATPAVNDPRAVDLGLDIEVSQGAIYTLIAKDVIDTSGNPLDPQGRELRFTGFVPPKPVGRRFELLDFIPDFNIAEDRTAEQGGCETDPGSGDLRRLLLVLQDVVDLLLCSVDEWTQIIDIDLAPEPFLDAILQDLGNPFADCISDLSVTDKRRLARILISIYKQKGTEQGIINAVRFFTGIEVTLDIINCRQFWQLGVSHLDIDTILAPPVGSPLWYSFFIVSPVVLTDEQRSRILCIADYMKGAHEHILGVIEPGGEITPSDYWILNVSLLGAATPPSTILA
jgi:phage tail-like protein